MSSTVADGGGKQDVDNNEPAARVSLNLRHDAAVVAALQTDVFERALAMCARGVPSSTIEVEAKVRVGSGGTGATRAAFEAVLDGCARYRGWTHADAAWRDTEDISLGDADGDMRCTRDPSNGGMCQFVRKRAVADVDVGVVVTGGGDAPAWVRFSLRTETRIDNPPAARQRWVRVKKRRSFVLADRWRIDLTRVWSGETSTQAHQQAEPTYEIEIECLGVDRHAPPPAAEPHVARSRHLAEAMLCKVDDVVRLLLPALTPAAATPLSFSYALIQKQ